MKIDIDQSVYSKLSQVPSSIFDACIDKEIFVMSWRLGLKELELS